VRSVARSDITLSYDEEMAGYLFLAEAADAAVDESHCGTPGPRRPG